MINKNNDSIFPNLQLTKECKDKISRSLKRLSKLKNDNSQTQITSPVKIISNLNKKYKLKIAVEEDENIEDKKEMTLKLSKA